MTDIRWKLTNWIMDDSNWKSTLDSYFNRHNVSDALSKNAVAHALTSAKLYNMYADAFANFIADVNEIGNFSRLWNEASRLDTLKDLFNNEIGRQIAEYAQRHGLSPADVEDLVIEAWKNGELVIDPQSDPRIPADGFPKPPPKWEGPPRGWSPGSGSFPGGHGPDSPGGTPGAPRWSDSGGWTNPPTCPLVVDLDGDGVELVPLAGSRAFFDLDVNGFSELTGWVKGDDGFLALDRNGNGRIDDRTELFGGGDIAQARTQNGFTELAKLNTNGDGRIDARGRRATSTPPCSTPCGSRWRCRGGGGARGGSTKRRYSRLG